MLPLLIPAVALVVIVYRLRSLTPNMRAEFLAGLAAVFCALAALAILLLGVKRDLMTED